MSDRTVRVTLLASVNNYVADMHRATSETEKAGRASETAAQKFERQNRAMQEVGQGMVAAGALAVVATGLAVKAAIDWETAWAGVTKTVDGSASEMATLEGELRELAKILPSTHTEIAAVAEAAGQLGVQRENIAAFTKTMIDLGETTNLSADEAATSIAQLMNVMGTAPDQVDNLGSALVALGNDGASTERDILQMAQRIAGAGRIVGLTEGEVLGFANALASVGIEAEAGGSAVSRIMTDIAIAVSKGGTELDKFATVAGISSADFQKAFKDDPAEAIATFVEGLGRINAEGGDVFSTLAELGQSDIRVSQALLGMANSGDLLRKSLDLGNSSLEENVALTEEAEKRYETTASKLAVMSNKVSDAAIEFGTAFLPAVTAVTEIIGNLADGFSDLPDPIQNVIALLGGAAALATLGGGVFLLAIPKIAEFRIALGVLEASSLPGIAAAAGGVTTAIGKTSTGLSKAAAFLTGPWGVALAAAAVGVTVLTSVLDSLKASSAEITNSLVTATEAADVFAVASEGREWSAWRDVNADLNNMSSMLDKVGEQNDNVFARFTTETIGFRGAVGDVGKELAKLAVSDLPSAQRSFSLFVSEADLSEKQLLDLLDLMPEYRDALIEQATAQGIQVAGMSEAERGQTLLKLAQDDGKSSAEKQADALWLVGDAAADVGYDVDDLADKIRNFGASQFDVERSTIAFHDALDGLSASLTDGDGNMVGSLDATTEAGRNTLSAMLEVASSTNDYAASVAAMGAGTEEVQSILDSGRQSIIDTRIALGDSADEAKAYADQLISTPALIQSTVELIGIDAATEKVRSFRDTIFGIPSSVTVGVGTVLKPAKDWATGGYTGPGGKYEPAGVVHRDEFVSTKETTSIPSNRAALEYMHAGGVIRGYAGGGLVQPTYMQSSPGYFSSSSTTTVVENVTEINKFQIAEKTLFEVTRNYKRSGS